MESNMLQPHGRESAATDITGMRPERTLPRFPTNGWTSMSERRAFSEKHILNMSLSWKETRRHFLGLSITGWRVIEILVGADGEDAIFFANHRESRVLSGP